MKLRGHRGRVVLMTKVRGPDLKGLSSSRAKTPKKTVTEAKLRMLKPATRGKRMEILDSVVPQVGIKSTDRGVHSFVCYTRSNGVPLALVTRHLRPRRP
jgi:hypothetical protein